MSFEMKRVVAGGILSAGLIGGGTWFAHEGFSGLEKSGHIEACQAPPVGLEEKCADVLTMSDTAQKTEVILTNVESWGGVGTAAIGVLGAVATLSYAVGKENLWGK